MKTIIRNLLKRFGYDIIKTGVPYIPVSSSDKKVKVGNYEILMPGNNIQLINYRIYPDMNAPLGRLAKIVSQKYQDMSVADIGANTGDTLAVIRSHADVPVIAIEGDELTYAYLEKNISQFPDVKIIRAFLSDKAGVEKVLLEKSGWNTTIIPGKEDGAEIVFTTLDDLEKTGQLGSRTVKLLKTDVEGYDTLILRGSLNLIRRNKPVLFFEYNAQNMLAIGENGLATLLSFRDLGYNKAVFFDHKGNLILMTSLENTDAISGLHHYASSSKNLLGYYDIAVFADVDTDLANAFVQIEREYL